MTKSNLERAFLTRWRQLAPDAPDTSWMTDPWPREGFYRWTL